MIINYFNLLLNINLKIRIFLMNGIKEKDLKFQVLFHWK